MVSLIILSFNTKSLLKDCIESVTARIENTEYEILVVDNASTDGTPAMVKKDFKDVKLIQNTQNLGFTKGNNIGAKHAQGEYLLFLNSDTKLDGEISTAVELLSQDNTIGVIGGVFKNSDGSMQKSFGNFYSLTHVFLLLLGMERLKSPRLASPLETDWVSGGFMLIRRALFEKFGGFDEHIFMYMEDMELCYRAKKAGYKVVITPSMSAYHIGQGSSNRTFAIVHIYKGLSYFYKKHKNYAEYLVLRLLLTAKAVFAIIIGVLFRKNYLIKTYKEAIHTII